MLPSALMSCSTHLLWRSMGSLTSPYIWLFHLGLHGLSINRTLPLSPVSILPSFFTQLMSLALQTAQTFTILCHAEAVSFRVSQKILFHNQPLMDLYQTFQFVTHSARRLVLTRWAIVLMNLGWFFSLFLALDQLEWGLLEESGYPEFSFSGFSFLCWVSFVGVLEKKDNHQAN